MVCVCACVYVCAHTGAPAFFYSSSQLRNELIFLCRSFESQHKGPQNSQEADIALQLNKYFST